MSLLLDELALDHCPHCCIAHPNAVLTFEQETIGVGDTYSRNWGVYVCRSCGGLITAWSTQVGEQVVEVFPSVEKIDEAIPAKPHTYLTQAIRSLHTPAGCIMLCAAAVDAMLKEKGLKQGNLYSRIEEAAKQHLITNDMAKWAHQVRLDSNDQRHADDNANLPEREDAQRCVEFTKALGKFLFELPALVTRGLKNSSPTNQ